MAGIRTAQTMNLGSHAPATNRRQSSQRLDIRTTARVHRHHQAGIADKQIVVTVTVYRRDTHQAVSNVNGQAATLSTAFQRQPIGQSSRLREDRRLVHLNDYHAPARLPCAARQATPADRKSTRLTSSP